jgi:hypothetical protein
MAHTAAGERIEAGIKSTTERTEPVSRAPTHGLLIPIGRGASEEVADASGELGRR